MKRTPQWLLVYCLALFCVAASSLNLAHAQTTTQPFPIFPKYMVMGVVYAPPGSASSVTYGYSNLVGSADSISTMNASTDTVTTSTTVGGGFLGLFGASTTTSYSDGWTTGQDGASAVIVQTTTGNSISTMGPISSSLGVNHDNDVIYIWLNPVVATTVASYNSSTGALALNWTGLQSNGCDPNDTAVTVTFYQYVRGCDSNQYPYPDIVGIPVWCLKNPYYPGQGCAQWLPYTSRPWDLATWTSSTGGPLPPGLTLQDYADILQADPFVALNGNAVNVCHNPYGPNLDPNNPETIAAPQVPSGKVNYAGTPNSCGAVGTVMNRFQPYGTVEYPMPGPDGLPSTYTGSFQYSQTNTSSQGTTESHTTSYSSNTTYSFSLNFFLPIPGGGSVPIANFNLAMSNGSGNSQTWQHQASNTSTTGNTSTANYSITGPQLSDNYQGPATYNVYLDNVYRTYAFYSSMEPQINLGTIGISSAPLNFGSVTVTNPVTASAAIPVTLINNSGYDITMVWPAITFNDPGFQIAQNILNDGSDHCSNQLIHSQQTCVVNVVFAPVISDAPNKIAATQYTINATMIAAGTESASSFQNVLVTAQTPVTGTAVVGTTTQGATLTPATIQNSAEPNVYNFPTSNYSAQTEQFTFKNYYSSSVTFPVHPAEIALTDAADFSIVSDTGTGGCSGAIVAAGSTCTFSVQFQPTTAPPPTGLFGTKVTALGVVNWPLPTGPTPTIPLAIAGTAGTVSGSISLGSISCSDVLGNGSGVSCSSTTITNNTAFTLNLTSGGGTNGFGVNISGCSSILKGASCTAPGTLTFTGQCNPSPNNPCGFSGTVSVSGTLATPGNPPVSGTNTASANISVCTTGCGGIRVTGAEQSKITTVPATYAKGSITVSPWITPAPAKGTLSITVGTFKATTSYAAGATGNTAAQALAVALNVTGSPVKAKASGSVVTLTSVTTGSAGNLAFQTTGDSTFQLVASGSTLTGGKNATTTTKYDGGTISVTTSGVTASATWGKTSTVQSIATALAASINKVAGAYWTASASGDYVTLVSVPPTAPSIWATVTDSKGFTPASFGATLTY